jgi:AcrR family transcriptional regulator
MTTDIGRPRDPRIDGAVLHATVDLLGETGYAALSVDAIARRAGTSKPAIYRRWPSKAHLVHEAVFPLSDATELPDTGSLTGDVREMMRRTVAVLTTPAAIAALPGLVGEMAADLTLHAALLERFGDILARGLTERLKDAESRGEVRPDVTAADLLEAIAGITFLALLTRAASLDEAWVERSATLPGANCWTPLAALTARSSRVIGRSPTTVISPTATACSRRPWASPSTPTFSGKPAGRCLWRSTHRSGVTGDGAATTPTRTTTCARSTRSATIASPATRATASTSR